MWNGVSIAGEGYKITLEVESKHQNLNRKAKSKVDLIAGILKSFFIIKIKNNFKITLPRKYHRSGSSQFFHQRSRSGRA